MEEENSNKFQKMFEKFYHACEGCGVVLFWDFVKEHKEIREYKDGTCEISFTCPVCKTKFVKTV